MLVSWRSASIELAIIHFDISRNLQFFLHGIINDRERIRAQIEFATYLLMQISLFSCNIYMMLLFLKKMFTKLQVFIILHVVALVYYIKRILSPAMFKVAVTLVVTIGM